jgi:hypothetical protein
MDFDLHIATGNQAAASLAGFADSCASRNFSASSAAMQPAPADVIAWR